MARLPKPMTTVTGMDMSILLTPAAYDGKEELTFGFNKASTKSVGLAKLAGKVCKLLWTQKGSNPINPSEGTDLVNLYSDGIGDPEALFAFTSICLADAESQIMEYQDLEGGKPEESLASLSLLDAHIEPQGITQVYRITISIHSAAGELADFELPSTIS